MVTTRSSKTLTVLVVLILLLAGCGTPSEAETTPTVVDLNAVRTEAVSTFAFSLTQTQIARPSATTTMTLIPTVTPLAIGTLTTGTVGVPVTSCNNLSFVRDVTVPDNTQMTPGQAFTKTWEVRNSGSCAWAPGYRFSLVSGDAMGGQALTLSQAVAAGATTQLSVAMTAPTGKTGTIRGDWRMADDKGVFFGDQIYVQIVIGGGTGPTSTTGAPTSTTPSATATPTP